MEIHNSINHLENQSADEIKNNVLDKQQIDETDYTLLRKFPDFDLSTIIQKQKLINDLPISEIGLPNQISKVLSRSRIFTIDQLLKLSEQDLWNMGRLGAYSIRVIYKKIKDNYLERDLVVDSPSEKDEIASSPPMFFPEMKFGNLRDFENISIDDIGFSIRVINSLKRAGIFTLDQLTTLNYNQLISIRNIGEKSLEEIQDKLTNILSLSKEEIFQSTTKKGQDLNQKFDIPYYLLRFDPKTRIEQLIEYPRARSVLFRNKIFTISDLIVNWELFQKFTGIGDTTYKLIVDSLRVPGFYPKNSIKLEYIHLVIEKIGDFSIEETNLPSQIKDVLIQNGLVTIRLVINKFHILKSTYRIKTDIRKEIIARIFYWIRNPDYLVSDVSIQVKTEKFIDEPNNLEPIDGVKLFLGEISDRNLGVISDLYGLTDSIPKIMQEVADKQGITRSRIQQIKSNVQRKISNSSNIKNLTPFLDLISNYIIDLGGLVSANALELISAEKIPDFQFILHPFLQFVFDTRIGKTIDLPILFIEDLNAYASGYTREFIQKLYKAIVDIFSENVIPLKWNELINFLIINPEFKTIDEKLVLSICQCAEDAEIIIQTPNGAWKNNNNKLTRADMIIATLRYISQPSHFGAIAEIHAKLFPDVETSPKNILAVLTGKSNLFTRVGRGTYGLIEWGIPNDGNVGNAVRRILASNDRPMGFDEIEREVLKTWDVQSSAILAAIKNDARFMTNEFGYIKLTDYGLVTKKRTKRDDESRLDRIFQTLKSIGSGCKINLIVEKHNSDNPNKPLTKVSVKSLLLKNPELFMRTGKDKYALTDWELEPYLKAEIDKEKEVLELIKARGPITFGTLNDLYNQKYPDRQLSENELKGLLRKLKERVINSRTGEYLALDRKALHFQSKQRYGNKPDHLQKIINVLEAIGTPSHVDYIVNGYQNKYPIENKQYSEIRNTLYTFKDDFKPYGEGVFGLPEWE